MNTKAKINFDDLNKKFESASPEEITSWAISTYSPRVGLTSSFGAQSAVLLHMVTQIDPKTPILFIDTGFLFKETYDFVKSLTDRLKLNLKTFRPTDKEIKEIQKRLDSGVRISCCDTTKVDQMKKALDGLDCWIAGLRRNQASTRKNVKIIEEYGDGLVKVHPIANWTSKDVHTYLTKHDLPYHPLWEKGYTSIGCEPCTQKPGDLSDERSGRWAGQDKTECGIHTFMPKKEQ